MNMCSSITLAVLLNPELCKKYKGIKKLLKKKKFHFEKPPYKVFTPKFFWSGRVIPKFFLYINLLIPPLKKNHNKF